MPSSSLDWHRHKVRNNAMVMFLVLSAMKKDTVSIPALHQNTTSA